VSEPSSLVTCRIIAERVLEKKLKDALLREEVSWAVCVVAIHSVDLYHCLSLQRDEQMQRLKRVQEYQQRKLQDKISADDQVSESLRRAARVWRGHLNTCPCGSPAVG
jgi:hypothetical protein